MSGRGVVGGLNWELVSAKMSFGGGGGGELSLLARGVGHCFPRVQWR